MYQSIATSNAVSLCAIIDIVIVLSQAYSCPQGAQGLPDPHQHRQGWALQSQGHLLHSLEIQQMLLTKRLQQKQRMGQQVLTYKGTPHRARLWWVTYCSHNCHGMQMRFLLALLPC